MIVVADINTLWRRKPFEALAACMPVLGLAPRDFVTAWRGRTEVHRELPENYCERSITMPPGWASRFPTWTAHRLWAGAQRMTRSSRGTISGLIVTSPHYLPLVNQVRSQVPTFYYGSDDYAQYAGWGGSSILRREAEIVRAASHSFFVSRSLAERAVAEYGVPPDRVSISPNATDVSFLQAIAPERIAELRRRFPELRGPVAGVVGAINERLDFELLLKCAEIPALGTLLMVGPVAEEIDDPAWHNLKRHPRCLIVGAQPHAELPVWMQMLDAALIPYRKTALNQSCSPMRLFDHLAAGKPIVSTNACQQILEFGKQVAVCESTAEFVRKLAERLSLDVAPTEVDERRRVAEANLWSCRARTMAVVIEACRS